jgi:hypothetical protein
MINSFELLSNILNEKDEEFTKKKSINFTTLLKDSIQGEENLINEAFKYITDKITNFLDIDIKQIKESRKQFDRTSIDLDNAYAKNAEAPKTKPTICEESERSLCATRKTFNHISLEYISNINKFYIIRNHLILDTVI